MNLLMTARELYEIAIDHESLEADGLDFVQVKDGLEQIAITTMWDSLN